jgi:hypothetical protein
MPDLWLQIAALIALTTGQNIPGRVLCAYYDQGGEGVSYHDTDLQNHGSGELNPADGTYLNEFRIHGGDTSYTKFNRKPDPIYHNSFDKVVPPADLPYVGWTEPGEWFDITVDVTRSPMCVPTTSDRDCSKTVRIASPPGTSPTPVWPALSSSSTRLRMKYGPWAPLRLSSMLSSPATGTTRIAVTRGVSVSRRR